jgi:hypothetical protein
MLVLALALALLTAGATTLRLAQPRRRMPLA